jgi:hypothetical protein
MSFIIDGTGRGAPKIRPRGAPRPAPMPAKGEGRLSLTSASFEKMFNEYRPTDDYELEPGTIVVLGIFGLLLMISLAYWWF